MACEKNKYLLYIVVLHSMELHSINSAMAYYETGAANQEILRLDRYITSMSLWAAVRLNHSLNSISNYLTKIQSKGHV